MTMNVEYIDLAENSIKALEKISHENSLTLLDNGAFCAILSFVDFFDLNLKRYVIITCVNMCKWIKTLETFNEKVKPALLGLTGLTKFCGNSELEKFILDQAIQCFYSIINSAKNNKFYINDFNVFEEIIQYGLVDNLFEVLNNFMRMMEENKNVAIYLDTFKNIVKVLQMLCENSSNISNLLINMNILEMIYHILKGELNHSSTNNNINSANHSIFNEIFPLIISFFPNNNTNSQKRLITDNTSHVYLFFAQKILPILINNFIHISSSGTTFKIVKIIKLFISFSNNVHINMFLDPLKVANILSSNIIYLIYRDDRFQRCFLYI